MRRVLLVDDEVAILESTSLLLTGLGFEVRGLEDHRRVREVMHAFRPDVVLHDVRMTGLDWPSHVAALRSDPVLASVPIVLFSASLDLAPFAAGLGIPHLLEKPATPDALVGALERAVTGRARSA